MAKYKVMHTAVDEYPQGHILDDAALATMGKDRLITLGAIGKASDEDIAAFESLQGVFGAPDPGLTTGLPEAGVLGATSDRIKPAASTPALAGR